MSQQNEERIAGKEKNEGEEIRPKTTSEVLGIEKELFDIEDQIVSIFSETISPEYMDIPSFHEGYVENDKYTVYIYTLSDEKVHSINDSSSIPENPKIGGVGITGLCSDLDDLNHALAGLRFSAEQLIEDTPLAESHFPISIVKGLFVDPNHQGQGIGFQISAHMWSVVQSNLPAIGVIWGRDSGNKNQKAENIIEKFEGEILVEYSRQWPDGWACVKCGIENECTCGCLVYGYGL